MKKVYELDNENNKIIQLKYASKQIGRMTDKEVKNWSMALLLKIHVITGWVIPASQLINILVDQFEQKLIEDYSNMNTDEIEYAFRKGGTITKDWGKEMNLNLIDQVLVPYLNNRLAVSAEEERKKAKAPDQRIYTDEEILNQRRGHIEQAYQAMRTGHYPILHRYFKEVLQADGLLNPDETVADFFVRYLNTKTENVYVHA